MTTKPPLPARPYFSSGPCAKPPGWSPERLFLDDLGRSHRGALGKQCLRHCIDLLRATLDLPDTHRIGIVPGSDTGAFELAMWAMLGERPVTALAWERRWPIEPESRPSTSRREASRSGRGTCAIRSGGRS